MNHTTDTEIEIYYISYPAEINFDVDEGNITINSIKIIHGDKETDLTFILSSAGTKEEYINVCQDHIFYMQENNNDY